MSGVVKGIGKVFKKVAKGVGKVAKGIWDVGKKIWKPALAAATAYFAVGMASGHFGDGTMMAKMPGFGEEGIFTKTADFLGMGTGSGPPAMPEMNTGQGQMAASSMPPVLQSTPQGMEGLNLKGGQLSFSTPTETPFGAEQLAQNATGGAAGAEGGGGGILNSLKEAPFGAYYLGGQVLSGLGQGLAQGEQLDEERRQFDTTMAQRNKELEASRQHAGAFYGVNADGGGGAISQRRANIPQINAPATQSPQVKQLTVDDLLKLQEQGLIS